MKKASEKKDKQTLVLLDAHALLHRAYHALPEFTNSRGVPTGGLYGYVAMILRIAAELKPDYIVACYDLPQKTFRHEAYKDYKGTRSKTDVALVEQIKASRIVCEKLAIPIYDVPGFEADDMLGTIVEQTKNNSDLAIIIATGDMDSLQLVRGKEVRVFTLKKGMNDTVVYDEESVKERFSFGPEFMTDYKGLRGDPSDNIIGVPGIGEKTATDLILKFGTLEKIYELIHKDRDQLVTQGIKDRIVKLLEEYEESALFSKTLATIRRDAPIVFDLPKKTWRESCDLEMIEPLLKEYEFKSLITRLKGILVSSKTEPVESETIPKETQIAMWLLDSEKNDFDSEDVLSYTRTHTISDAQKVLDQSILEQGLDFIYRNIELPLVPILTKMQEHGVLIDSDFLKKFSQELHEHLSVCEQKIYTHVGHEFNINSPKQLGEILFGEMMIHATVKGFKIKKTASGTYSTRESDLEKLVEVHPIIADIFEYREIQKLLSTYIDSIPLLADEHQRIHPELLQMGAATGRFAAQNPNIQNIPIRSEQGRKIRKAFIAPTGSVIVAVDYSQIELRSAAILSRDPIFMETFREGKDVHASVAARVFHVTEGEVTSDMRRKAKVINFGILFGMGVTALQKNLGTTRAEAQSFYDEYFKQLGGLSQYIDNTILTAKKVGYTKTLFGRKRFFPALKSPVPFIKAMAERAASNAPIQGTTADIIKLAMINVDREIHTHKLQDKVFMVMQIHDELVFEVEESVLEQAEALIKKTMEEVLLNVGEHIQDDKDYLVPITVSVSHGRTWGDAKE